MTARTRLTTVETVREERSWLFTVADEHGVDREVILVPCDGGVEAWVNRCTHEAQRLDAGRGVAMRDGEIVVEDGAVSLADEDVAFEHEGGLDDGGGPSSTSHLSF